MKFQIFSILKRTKLGKNLFLKFADLPSPTSCSCSWSGSSSIAKVETATATRPPFTKEQFLTDLTSGLWDLTFGLCDVTSGRNVSISGVGFIEMSSMLASSSMSILVQVFFLKCLKSRMAFFSRQICYHSKFIWVFDILTNN